MQLPRTVVIVAQPCFLGVCVIVFGSMLYSICTRLLQSLVSTACGTNAKGRPEAVYGKE